MSLYTCKAKATNKFGITFRSQLEAKWAYAFTETMGGQSQIPFEWEYVDDSWRDFVLHFKWGDANIEIKPFGIEFAEQAIQRFKRESFDNHLFVFMGEPIVRGPEGIDCSGIVCCGKSVCLERYIARPAIDFACLKTMVDETTYRPFYLGSIELDLDNAWNHLR